MLRATSRASAASVILFLILLIIFPLMRLITFPATFQRVHSQQDLYIFEDNGAVIRMIIKKVPNPIFVRRVTNAPCRPTWICYLTEASWTVQFPFHVCAPLNSWQIHGPRVHSRHIRWTSLMQLFDIHLSPKLNVGRNLPDSYCSAVFTRHLTPTNAQAQL